MLLLARRRLRAAADLAIPTGTAPTRSSWASRRRGSCSAPTSYRRAARPGKDCPASPLGSRKVCSRRTPSVPPATAVAAGALGVAATSPDTASAGRADQQSTQLISRALGGGTAQRALDQRGHLGRQALLAADRVRVRGVEPRGRRHERPARTSSRSSAPGSINNDGHAVARPAGRSSSRAASAARPANGPSYGASVSRRVPQAGQVRRVPLGAPRTSSRGDTNGKVDAFLSRHGAGPQAVSLRARPRSGAWT